jgi:hypothetical protein
MRLIFERLLKVLLAVGCLTATVVHAQDAQPTAVLLENVRIFDGKGSTLSAPSNVLARGNEIERIATAPIPVDRRTDVPSSRAAGAR